jgi:hypothetical protein
MENLNKKFDSAVDFLCQEFIKEVEEYKAVDLEHRSFDYLETLLNCAQAIKNLKK